MQVTLLDQGTHLMIYGMGTVFVFLSVLVVAVSLMSKVIESLFPETSELGLNEGPTTHNTAHQAIDQKTLAIIQAAIHKHRRGKK